MNKKNKKSVLFRYINIIMVFIAVITVYSANAFADTTRYGFTVTYLYSGPDINVKSISSGKVFNVKYGSPIKPEVGDTVTILIDENNNWKTIINEKNGRAATIKSVRRY
ncbi:hypothetical protein QUF75_13875 [Desulfococcaceae bacterium HSG7]|nr:hypothetical protein [Desulfococcaceae bacterium HSG7]